MLFILSDLSVLISLLDTNLLSAMDWKPFTIQIGNKFFYRLFAYTANKTEGCQEKNAIVLARVRKKKGEGQGMWQRLWWPLSCRLNKKFSFKATARPGQPFVKGDRRVPLQTRGHTQCVGRVSLGVPYLHSDSLRVWDRRESQCVAFSLSALFTLTLSLSFSFFRFQSHISCLFFALALRILVWTSLRCIVGPFERSQPIGVPHDDFIMKKRNVRVDRTPLQSARDETRPTERATRPLACLECLPSLAKYSSELKKKKKIKGERIKTPRKQAEERKGDSGNVGGVVPTVGRTLRDPLIRVRDRFLMLVEQGLDSRPRWERTSSSFFSSWRPREPLISSSSRRFRVRHER